MLMNNMEYAGNKNVVCERIKHARRKLKMTQDQLAAKMQTYDAHIDQQMISKIERNRRIVTDYEIVLFAKVLNVEVNWLLGEFIEKMKDKP